MKQIVVPFKGWDLVAWINRHDGEHLIAVKPIAEAVGVEWARQYKKLQSDPRFTTVVHMYHSSKDEKQREMLCLPVKQLNGWLYSINANKVKPEVREKLMAFQEECHLHLHSALSGKVSSELVSLLKQMIENLERSLNISMEENKLLRTRVSHLETQQEIVNSSEQLFASMGGQMLAHSRKTKSIRTH